MLTKCAKLFLINASSMPIFEQLSFYSNYYKNLRFEFIINEKLELLECTQLTIANKSNNYNYTEKKIINFNQLYNVLFELNHIRINPMLNNYLILKKLANTLLNLGIKIKNLTLKNSDYLQICFNPLGEIENKVRFYCENNNQIIFLSNTFKSQLI